MFVRGGRHSDRLMGIVAPQAHHPGEGRRQTVIEHSDPIKLHPEGVDLRKEQEATLSRPRMTYTFMARFFFAFMDFVYGKKLTVPKIKLIEILARIPYHAWEIKAYWRLTFGYADEKIRREGQELVKLGRLSQDNEYWHLIIAVEKIKEDDIKQSGFWYTFMPKLFALSYSVFARTLATISLKQSFYFNAMFEDHAEHEYANFVKNHPELDSQPIKSELVKQFGGYDNWGDVFRKIGLDERAHKNNSLRECGRGAEQYTYVSISQEENDRFLHSNVLTRG